MTIRGWKHIILKSLHFDHNDKVSIFINKRTALDKIASMLREMCNARKNNFRLTSFDIELPTSFQDLGIEIDYSWNYLSEGDCRYVDEFFFKGLTKGWFLFTTSPQDYINENNKRLLGRAVEFEFIHTIFVVVKYIEVINKIFAEYKPTKIIIIEDKLCLVNIIRLFQEKYKFAFIHINPKSDLISNSLKILPERIKGFLRDLIINLLDFFILRYISISKKFERKIIIDHRLYKKFAKSKLKEQFLICLFEQGLKIRLQLLGAGLFYVPFRHTSYFVFPFKNNAALNISKNWDKIKLRGEIKDIFRYKDIIFWSAIEKYVSRFFLKDFPRIMHNVTVFQKFALLKKVKLTVMRNDVKELEQTLIETARPLKVPSLVVQHGLYGDVNYSHTLYADMTAVWGKASIDWFRQFGYQDNRFTITGNPMYDELYHRVSADSQDLIRKKVCRKLNLVFEKKIITFLTSSNYLSGTCFTQGNRMGFMLRAVLKTMRAFSDVQLIVKIHPYDEDNYANYLMEDVRDSNFIIIKNFNIFDILTASDLAITVDSSSGLEALILDKPLITLDFYKSATVVPLGERGAAIAVKKPEEIELAIKNSLYDEAIRETLRMKRKEFVFDYAYKIDGKATDRVADLIMRLCEEGGR